jgi:hypothetical protein
MISAQDFYVSPKYIALKTKVEDRLNAIPDYARAKAEMEDGRQMEKSDAAVAQAKLDEKKAKEEMNNILARAILDRIKDPEDAINVYYHLEIR